jgi:hypothetical protein
MLRSKDATKQIRRHDAAKDNVSGPVTLNNILIVRCMRVFFMGEGSK